MTWNWSLLLITFLISLPIVLRKTIGLKNLGESYNDSLGLGITIVNKILKWLGQCPNSMQVLAMAIILFWYVLSLITHFKWPHDSLLGPRADEMLHFTMALVNSSSKKGNHNKVWYKLSSLNTFSSIWQNWAVLKDEWRACQRFSKSEHSWLLYLIISIAGRFYLLIQLIRFQGPHFLLAYSWIFRLKKVLFMFLTVF